MLALFQALKGLVATKPANLLQELKSLVSKFGRKSVGAAHLAPQSGKGQGPAQTSTAVGKGKGAGKAPGKAAGESATVARPTQDKPAEQTWSQVVRNKGSKGGDKPSGSSDSWRLRKATTAGSWKGVVALAASSEQAKQMWELLAGVEDLDATFIFNYSTPKGWVEVVEFCVPLSKSMIDNYSSLCYGVAPFPRLGH